MAIKITFTFTESIIAQPRPRDLKFANGLSLIAKGVLFTPAVEFGTDPYTFDNSFSETSWRNEEVVKGASVNNFANNFYLYLNAQMPFLGFYFETLIVGNIVTLIVGNNSEVNNFRIDIAGTEIEPPDDFWLTYTTEAYTIPTPSVPEVLPEQIILSRSPFHFKVSPGVTFDEITAEVFIYRGHKVDDRPATSNFQLSKTVVQVGQPTISFDVHKLVNDYVKNKYTYIGLGGGAFTTSTLDSVWVYIDSKIKLAGVEQHQANQTLLAVDGFGYHTELYNPLIGKKVLSSINTHTVYNTSVYPLYFITEGLTSIVADGDTIPFTFNQNYSNQKIGYFDASTYSNIIFTYGSEVITHVFNQKDECKYPLINCIFKNKYGFWQTIPFNKLSKKAQEFTNESYNGLISNFGSYSLNQHEKQTFNVNGKEKITVNTDFISEDYNALFTELMLSEFVYLEENGQVLPVNITKNSFEKKTKLINKLIQYSMDFEYSFNLLNDVL
jgi:hypothetical protein